MFFYIFFLRSFLFEYFLPRGGVGGTAVGCILSGYTHTHAQVGCVLPALAELFRNPLWRLRAAVAEALPALVSCTLCDRLKEEVG